MAMRANSAYLLAGQTTPFWTVHGHCRTSHPTRAGAGTAVGVGVAVEAATGAVVPAAAAPFRLPWQLQLQLLPAYTIELISITGWSPYNAPAAVNRSPSPTTVHPPPPLLLHQLLAVHWGERELCLSIRMSVRGTRCGWLNALVGWLADWLPCLVVAAC